MQARWEGGGVEGRFVGWEDGWIVEEGGHEGDGAGDELEVQSQYDPYSEAWLSNDTYLSARDLKCLPQTSHSAHVLHVRAESPRLRIISQASNPSQHHNPSSQALTQFPKLLLLTH